MFLVCFSLIASRTVCRANFISGLTFCALVSRKNLFDRSIELYGPGGPINTGRPARSELEALAVLEGFPDATGGVI